ncbi:serine hydrolase [uncultured Psychroserpens sp.]|uniref:serine hydrolase n=1 Tax=uncultured Psychroserpens sp. TaxID=255436 RepID=UPI00262C55AB|nr:serine hydrolase [uncultured Psychroserpens sp.]
MKLKTIIFATLVLISSLSFSQNLEKSKLDEFFNSLEKRNEAMGSISISKNGKLIYSKAIGYKTIEGKNRINANTDTHYRIWSITKTYTAVMIFQLIEEGRLSLETTLDTFYPLLPNAESITIEHMLSHKSGLFDYVNDTDEEISLHGISSKDTVAAIIAKLKPNFKPGEQFSYSNTNYLFLGYIIELLDKSTYEIALSKRISAKANLNNTYFGTQTISKINNVAETYQYDNDWKTVSEEANYTNHLATADGGIVSTIEDMTLFIDALFDGRLVSKKSLNKMLEGEGFYRLGLMKTQFESSEGFGHTGGWISESSLFHYPKDNLSIAYATNGIVLRKEDILNDVLKIIHGKPFTISMNRNLQALLIFGIGLLFFLLGKLKFNDYVNTKYSLYVGYLIAVLFWLGTMFSGFLYGNDYSHIRDGIPLLDSFYSGSGTFNAGIQFTIAMLFIPFIYSIYKICKQQSINILPLIPLVFIPINMIGSSLFPFPNQLFPIFANSIILSFLGPLLAIIFWRAKRLSKIRIQAVISFFLMMVSIGFMISRSSIPEFVHMYWGIIQRLLFLGWTSWIVFMSIHFTKVVKLGNESNQINK